MPDYSDLYNSSVPVLPPQQQYNPQSFLPNSNFPAAGTGPKNGMTPGTSSSRGFLGDSGYLAGPGAQQLSDLTSGNFNMWDALDPTGLLSGLFGGKKSSGPSWQPQMDNGLVYQTNPNDPSTGWQNPVNVNNIPGAGQRFSTEGVQQANQINVMRQLLPYYQDAVNKSNMQSAMGNLNISQATSPGYAQLMTQLFNTYGPQLNAIGNGINRQNALAQANTESQVMAGPGKNLVNQAYDLSQVFDKPYYDTRATTAGRVGDLLKSVDLNAGLSPTENNEIAQGLAREGYARGTATSPSATETIGNAMQYGNAGYQRRVQQQSILGNAIQTANSFLPASKSGVDVFQVATGRPSTPNQGAGIAGSATSTATNPQNSTAASMSQNLLSGQSGLMGQNIQQSLGQQQIDLQKKDWADYLGQVMGAVNSGVGSVAGIAGMAGMCWVAREVYGENNPKWMLFRQWLITKAPKWFFNIYLKHGPKIARYISDKPILKAIIKHWMDKRICQLKAQDTKNFNMSSSCLSRLMDIFPLKVQDI